MMNKIKNFHLWLIALIVALMSFVVVFGAAVVLAGNTENVKLITPAAIDNTVEELNLTPSPVKQDIQKLWTDNVIFTRQYFDSFTERLPDASTGTARLLILSTIMTLWLSTRYFTRLLS